MVGVRDVLGAVADRVAEVDQDLVEGTGRLMPFHLLDAVRGGGFASPDLLQRGDLGP
jgi:hypothetical protein